MTLGPAQRLEKFVPGMATKGRLSPGMDADVTVFDPGAHLLGLSAKLLSHSC
jgi:dihydroorotase